MKQDNTFFSEQGLTATSADFVANLAKEMLRKNEAEIEGINFVCEEIALINNPKKSEMRMGMDKEEVNGIKKTMKRIIRLKSLIAWLREAIKAKNRLLEEIGAMNEERFCKEIKGLDCMPEYPARPSYMTKDDYMATLSVADRCKMYNLETKAAVLGKLLHKDGAYEQARERLYEIKSKPTTLDAVRSLVYNYVPSVDSEVVDDVYFKLTNEYREAQAGLNAYLHAMQTTLQEDKIKKDEEYRTALEKYGYEQEHITAELKEWKSKETKRVSDLKIIMPVSLKEIYDEVQKVGK